MFLFHRKHKIRNKAKKKNLHTYRQGLNDSQSIINETNHKIYELHCNVEINENMLKNQCFGLPKNMLNCHILNQVRINVWGLGVGRLVVGKGVGLGVGRGVGRLVVGNGVGLGVGLLVVGNGVGRLVVGKGVGLGVGLATTTSRAGNATVMSAVRTPRRVAWSTAACRATSASRPSDGEPVATAALAAPSAVLLARLSAAR